MQRYVLFLRDILKVLYALSSEDDLHLLESFIVCISKQKVIPKKRINNRVAFHLLLFGVSNKKSSLIVSSFSMDDC